MYLSAKLLKYDLIKLFKMQAGILYEKMLNELNKDSLF